ncbi:MAG: diacylglycerol/lipid kinase family protein [Enterocloster sp.]
MKKMLFVFNPRSGKEQIRGQLLDILDIFSKAGYEVRVHVTQGQNDACDMVRRRGRYVDLVVCSGGDGTLNETISGIMRLKRTPLLGYIPAGSTNDFASSLQIPKRMKDAAAAVAEGNPFAIDIGHFCRDRYFVYIAAFGAFTEVSYLTSQDKKNLLGHQAYMLEAVKSLSSIKPYHMRVEWEDNVLEEDFAFGMVTNTLSVGGFKGLVNQSVALNDGEFEVLLIRMPRMPGDLSNIISYMFLKEEPNEYVYKFKASSIRFLSDMPVDWVLDGEYGGSRTEVRIENMKERIPILLKKSRKNGSKTVEMK